MYVACFNMKGCSWGPCFPCILRSSQFPNIPFPSQLGVQSDELETLSHQKTSDEQRLLMAQSRHDQDFSSSRVEASKQMAAARDIALRQIPDDWMGRTSQCSKIELTKTFMRDTALRAFGPSPFHIFKILQNTLLFSVESFLLSESGRRKERTREQMQETLRRGALREKCQNA